jgi:class 3 adenylate cyclase
MLDTIQSIQVTTEAIVVIDIIDSTKMSNRFGWYAVSRGVLRDLRSLIKQVGSTRGLSCQKSTGDGYLLTFRNPHSAEAAAVSAVEAAFELLILAGRRNSSVPEEQVLNLRFAVHIGEVDVLPDDREGPHVSYAFRHESISRASLAEAINPIPPDDLYRELCSLQRGSSRHIKPPISTMESEKHWTL